jgi:ADP-ribosylglycohydrolase
MSGERVRGMIWGQFVGDAAALGAHWIYDLDEMAHAYPEGIRGFEAPHEGHYHFGKQPGDQTHYGDAALLLLESVAERGQFDAADFAQRFAAYFSDPHCTSYRDHSTKDTLTHLALDPHNLRSGANADDQPATVTRLAGVVAVHRANPSVVEALTRITQNNDRAVTYVRAHAQILATLLEGKDLQAALAMVTDAEPAEKIRDALAARAESVTNATQAFGQGCPLPKSFPAAVQAALKHPDAFRECILATIAAGGDSAGRASMIGAWLGAALGLNAVPKEWRERLRAGSRIEAAIRQLPLPAE